MKKLFIFLAFTFLLSSATEAQVSFKPGVKAGLNFSRFTNSNASNKTDFYLGGLLAMKFAKIYTLQPELVYSRQGANRSETVLNQYGTGFSQTKTKYNLDYLCLGVINKFTFNKGFQVVVGPSIDFKVADNFSSNYAKNPIGLDIALVGGLGYSFSNGLTVEARVKQGMADIFGNNYNNSTNNTDTNNNGNYDEVVLNQLFQVGVSYSFDLK